MERRGTGIPHDTANAVGNGGTDAWRGRQCGVLFLGIAQCV